MNEKGDILKILNDKIPFTMKVCFLSGMISGLLMHAYMLTNKLPNWDDINNVGSYAVGAEFGRWFLKIVHLLTGKWSVPWLSGIFAIVLISAAACFVVSALGLKTSSASIRAL